jgi:hypothetical protein
MLARKEKKTIGFTLSHDCWIGTNGDILMLDPVNHDVATTDTPTSQLEHLYLLALGI